MFRVCAFALLGAMFVMSGGLIGQDAKKDGKKDDPPVKAKGVLPTNWGKLGLSDDQKQQIYKIQNKYDEEIDKLDAKIKELKAARTKDMKGVLTADQKKRLEEILLGKDK
jgi:Spy/CpxP family protein refolding chaperone